MLDAEVPTMNGLERQDLLQELGSPYYGSEIGGIDGERASFNERSVPSSSSFSPCSTDHVASTRQEQSVYSYDHEQPEVLLEMPPPHLSNRKSRKLSGGVNLNHKYNRWKVFIILQ